MIPHSIRTVYFALAILDIGILAIGAIRLWAFRKQISIANYTGILLSAMAFDQICQIVASLHRTNRGGAGVWFLSWWMGGRLVRIASSALMVFYILGITKGKNGEGGAV